MIRHTAGTTPNHRSFFDQWLLAVSSDTSSGWAEWTGDSLRSTARVVRFLSSPSRLA